MLGPDEATQLESELSEEDLALLDKLAEGIVKRRMTAVAVFTLESLKPMSFVSSQLMIFLRPIIHAIWQEPVTYDRLARILERRASLELLLRRIESKQ